MEYQAQAVAKAEGSILRGALLISGTMIGGGMLALPVLTASYGLLPTCIIYLICWFAMSTTGMYLFEAGKDLPKETNLITLAKEKMGIVGLVLTWCLYLFLFYCLMTAYIDGVSQFISLYLPSTVSAPMVAAVIFLPLLLMSVHALGALNLALMVGLFVSFLLFVLVGLPTIEPVRLVSIEWTGWTLALPIAIASFSYQGTLPSIAAYLGRDPKKVKPAIWLGTLLPLVLYVLWEVLILGTVPASALLEAKQMGYSAVIPFKETLHEPFLEGLGESFAFFALFTSFLGVSMGLYDFLSDGLEMKKEGLNKLILALLVLIPPLLFNVIGSHLFLSALHYAGGIGCAALLGIFPICMIWKEKKRRIIPLVLLIFFGVEVTLQLYSLF